jgi:hypothetical protein
VLAFPGVVMCLLVLPRIAQGAAVVAKWTVLSGSGSESVDDSAFSGGIGGVLGGILKLDAISTACATPAATLAVRCV